MNKKGFTLIELLAVIIILGILMIIAIPSVTSYINNSRKEAYVDTAKEIVSGTRNIVNEGKLGMYDTNTTYYIPASYIKTENSSKSPYGDFTQAYVAVIYDGKGYKYYWTSVDDTGQGVDKIRPADKLEADDIVSDINASDIKEKIKTTGIGSRSNILVLDENGQWSGQYQVEHYVGENGELSDSEKNSRTKEDLLDDFVLSYTTNDVDLLYGILPPFLSELFINQGMDFAGMIQDAQEYYGDNLTVTYTIGDMEELSADQVERLNANVLRLTNIENAFSSCKIYETTFTYKGSLAEEVVTDSIPFCVYDGALYIVMG